MDIPIGMEDLASPVTQSVIAAPTAKENSRKDRDTQNRESLLLTRSISTRVDTTIEIPNINSTGTFFFIESTLAVFALGGDVFHRVFQAKGDDFVSVASSFFPDLVKVSNHVHGEPGGNHGGFAFVLFGGYNEFFLFQAVLHLPMGQDTR